MLEGSGRREHAAVASGLRLTPFDNTVVRVSGLGIHPYKDKSCILKFETLALV